LRVSTATVHKPTPKREQQVFHLIRNLKGDMQDQNHELTLSGSLLNRFITRPLSILCHFRVGENRKSDLSPAGQTPAPSSPVTQDTFLPLDFPPDATVVCTIISKNYLASARTLMKSIRDQHDDLVLVTLLVDAVEGCFNPADEPFLTILASDLGIPRWEHFSMKYDIMELNTAVKPYLLETLLKTYQAQKVIYFDPDIVVYRRLDDLLALLNQHMVVLTPHITEPLKDNLKPSELDFLQVGTFNLGFFALSRQGKWQDLLAWWQERLYNYCTREVERGLFVDQHWMDLLPSLFDSIYVLRDPGYNVAYWNIQTRDLQTDASGHYTINERPLTFFHFSGFSVETPEIVSKHQNRFTLSQLNPHYQRCFMEYRELLLRNGYATTREFPYLYARFADDVPIPDVLRVCLRNYDLNGDYWADPYDIASPDAFRAWAIHPNALPELRYLSPYALSLYKLRRDLRPIFPDPLGDSERAYAEWFVVQEHTSEVFHSFYVEPVRAALEGSLNLPPAEIPFPKKKARFDRFADTFRYYRGYPIKVKPHLPPEAITLLPDTYTGPMNTYGWVRTQLRRLPIFKTIRRMVGLRLILTARYFFSYSGDVLSADMIGRLPDFELPPLDTEGDTPPPLYGVNIVGYLQAKTGVGQIARSLLECLQTVEFPVASYALVHPNEVSEVPDKPLRTSYAVNIFNVNADMTFRTRSQLGARFYRRRYNIGYWFWEMPHFPDRWLPCFSAYDEIWVASRFVRDAVAEKSPIPVTHMPVSIEVPLPEHISRAEFGIPEESFVVLYVFDALSVIERKNPLAAIAAFRMAFTEQERRRVRLVLKINNLSRFPEEHARIREELDRVNGMLLTTHYTRLQINALIHHSDVYLSLHRSEGYGLTIAEAMYLGKPVVATAFSGNVDFMTETNSYPVPYKLVRLQKPYPPYDIDNEWADPDLDVAAAHLRAIYNDPEAARERAERAARDIRENFNRQVVGMKIAQRLDHILQGIETVDADPS
jgi:glycosyltransferase involved in cell wall biosynthesis